MSFSISAFHNSERAKIVKVFDPDALQISTKGGE